MWPKGDPNVTTRGPGGQILRSFMDFGSGSCIKRKSSPLRKPCLSTCLSEPVLLTEEAPTPGVVMLKTNCIVNVEVGFVSKNSLFA
jgi:hypothetical protein